MKVVRLIAPPVSSRRVARRVTSAFHAGSGGDEERRSGDEEARRTYQEASQLSTRLYSTSRWVVRVLFRDMGRRGPLRCLEVGAVNTQLLDCRRLQTRAIDLRSTSARIEQLDFFDLQPSTYDVVVCSLVLNCVEHADRYRFLLKLRDHLETDHSLLFLILPKRLLSSRFPDALRTLGLAVVLHHATPKLAHFCLSRVPLGEAMVSVVADASANFLALPS
eukprot:CAMPEP_0198672202 /NCGR_PEP_ID=MMETSP1467-20131203/89932_1 /TAXON_ID=1462469 /ORGANISM="unid. sp., Strain CCMP2135" /LENGTH=219 /DNA_ID=CAMNT_0044409031 /DNA_START=31 /DNA_END=690 /DNA_ORIENTATION=+